LAEVPSATIQKEKQIFNEMRLVQFSVFGTPLTGAIFAIEVLYFGKDKYNAVFCLCYDLILAFYVVRNFEDVETCQYYIKYSNLSIYYFGF
jgi:H+/Cl- antiporter ClcA